MSNSVWLNDHAQEGLPANDELFGCFTVSDYIAVIIGRRFV